jgi:O-antigen biosynthesis protein
MPAPQIDVIVPVHGAGPVFRRCAASLVRHVNAGQHRVIVILDGPPDDETVRAVDELRQADADLVVLAHDTPRGFIVSVNQGVAVSDRDVVLLNSDTQVTRGWLEKLAAAAGSDPAIATVTPFSNNATICSLPTFLAENTLPTGYDVDALAALVERVAAREYPPLPTGVGACLYIKREVLREAGAFDEAFGLGYGEEIDFCLRASALGYRHVLDDATFIFHEGSRSFGASRQRRVRRAERVIRARYPAFRAQVSRFIREDPIARARGRVLAALRPTRAGAAPAADPVLHVVHGWPPWAHGGAELYAYWLAHAQARERDVAVYARFADPDRMLGEALEHLDLGVRVRLVANNFVQRNPLCRNGLHCPAIARDFARYLDEVRPAVVHVHHLAGHCASLLSVAARRRIPILYQAQDWWPICARVNLCDRDHTLCSGPAAFKCARCLPMTNLPPATLNSAILQRARRTWIRRQLSHATAVVAGSQFIADSYRRWQVLPSTTPVHVIDYGVQMEQAPARDDRANATQPVRFGYIGALLPHKGVHLCIDAVRRVRGREAGARQAELHVWGTSDDRRYRESLVSDAAGADHIRFHGAFAESDKAAILGSLDVLIVPSVGLESFGLVAREALACGVPVIASRRGALVELFGDGASAGDAGSGAFFTPEDPADLARLVERVIDDPDLVGTWRRQIRPVKRVAQHAAEIDAIYASLIQPRRR